MKKVDYTLCSGCRACEAVCPKRCISMEVDRLGLLYPVVDAGLCIDCGLCDRVCQYENPGEASRPLETYAAYNRNEQVRMASSSGGIFTLLAEDVIRKGGVVFGARFDENWDVLHDYTETMEGLAAFRGSKYVQSDLRDSLVKARAFLKVGRPVLFSGTPCQIAGLKKFLRKDYDNLIAVDCVCHGVPAPAVWRGYLASRLKANGTETGQLENFSFRDKSEGWKGYSLSLRIKEKCGERVESVSHNKSDYIDLFLRDLSLRPSCYNCSAKAGRSGSDITLGDFWGIEKIDPEIDDDKGMSLVMVHTEKGKKAFDSLEIFRKSEKYEDALRYNPSIEASVNVPRYRNLFMGLCGKYGYGTATRIVLPNTKIKGLIRRILLLFYHN